MTKKYYRLRDDIYYPNRWYLGDILDENNWEYRNSANVEIPQKELQLEVYRIGEEMDFTLTEAYGIPIVSEAFKQATSTIKDLIFIPISFKDFKASTNYYVMIVNSFLEAVDEKKSSFKKFIKNDPIRPDKAGQYKYFYKLVIDSAKVENEIIFRLKGFSSAIIISEVIKSKIDFFNGIKLNLVSI